MLYWFEFAGTAVFAGKRRIGHIENIMLEPDKKVITGFLLEKRNRDLWPRFFKFSQIQTIEADSIKLKDTPQIEMLSGAARKNYILAEDFINHSILDEKGEWIGRVVDFAFNPTNGILKEMIISAGLLDDIWHGRKSMPVLSNVEFSRELIHIDQEIKEEISSLDKGLKNWLDREKIPKNQ